MKIEQRMLVGTLFAVFLETEKALECPSNFKRFYVCSYGVIMRTVVLRETESVLHDALVVRFDARIGDRIYRM